MLSLLDLFATVLLFGGIFALFFTYAGLPLSLKLIRDIIMKISGEDFRAKNNNIINNIDIQIIIPCYNEAKTIEKRINNILKQEYPATMLSILIISDGSTDNTDDIARKIITSHRNIILYSTFNNIGKNSAMNKAYESGYFTAPILCFTDADTEFDLGSLKSAIKYFSDPHVGLVGGHIVYWPSSESAAQAEGVFRRLENFLRQMEGDLGWLVSGSGSFLMMRRELYEPLLNHLNNDFAMPLSVLAQGYAAKFDRYALARSGFPSATRDALRRRKRTIIRALTTLAHYRPRLPWHLRLVLFWHKTVRFYSFPLQVGILATNLLLSMAHPNSFWSAMLWLQVAFYGLAGFGFLVEQLNWKFPLVYLPYQFTLQNAVAFTAVISFLQGQRISKWSPHR